MRRRNQPLKAYPRGLLGKSSLRVPSQVAGHTPEEDAGDARSAMGFEHDRSGSILSISICSADVASERKPERWSTRRIGTRAADRKTSGGY